MRHPQTDGSLTLTFTYQNQYPVLPRQLQRGVVYRVTRWNVVTRTDEAVLSHADLEENRTLTPRGDKWKYGRFRDMMLSAEKHPKPGLLEKLLTFTPAGAA